MVFWVNNITLFTFIMYIIDIYWNISQNYTLSLWWTRTYIYVVS